MQLDYYIFVTAAFLFLLNFLNIECSRRSQSIKTQTTTQSDQTSTHHAGTVTIPDSKIHEGFIKILSMLEAYNIKKKYEVGKLAVHLIDHMKNKGTLKPDSVEKEVSYRGVDKNPSATFELVVSFYKKYTATGFISIEKELRTALKNYQGYIIDRLMYLAIRNENIKLVSELLNANGLILRTYDMYKFALANLVEEGTEKCEAIVDLLSGPEAYTTPANWFWNKLNLGFACMNVFDYITENDFPMLKRALDEGLDPNQNFASHGSILGLSVMFGCTRCVKILIERGANVNTPISYKNMIYMEGTNKTQSPEGWSPLMLAVADGQSRIVKILLESGFIQSNSILRAKETNNLVKCKTIKSQISELLVQFDKNQGGKLKL